MYKRILIVGDAGRGKSTFAEKLSKKLSIPFCSTDDFYWKIKFTVPNDRQKSIEEIAKIYEKEKWIVDGTTRHLIQDGLEKSEVIYLLEFTHILHQYYYLVTRYFKRKHERFTDTWKLIKHVTHKKYTKGYGNHLPHLHEMLKPYENKVVKLNSFKEINRYLNSI